MLRCAFLMCILAYVRCTLHTRSSGMTCEGMRMQAIFSGEFLSKFMEGHLTFSVQEHSEFTSIRRPHCSLTSSYTSVVQGILKMYARCISQYLQHHILEDTLVCPYNGFNIDSMADRLDSNTAITLRNYDLGTRRYVTENPIFHQNNYIITER